MQSTGVFLDPDLADSDGAGKTAGPNPFPPFPGQDFITPPTILNDGNHVAVISVEPYPDMDPSPFAIKILANKIAPNAPVLTSLPMANITNKKDISMRVILISK